MPKNWRSNSVAVGLVIGLICAFLMCIGLFLIFFDIHFAKKAEQEQPKIQNGLVQIEQQAPRQKAKAPSIETQTSPQEPQEVLYDEHPIEHWISLLRSKKLEDLDAAMSLLRKVGPKGAAAIPELMKLLEQGDDLERLMAYLTLGAIGKESVPSLILTLIHADLQAQYFAVKTLDLIGVDGEEAVPHLLNMLLKRTEPDFREAVSRALGICGENSINRLLEAFSLVPQDAYPFVLDALGRAGQKAQNAVPFLENFLRTSQDEQASLHAVRALGSMGAKAAAVVIPSLNDSRPNIRSEAVSALQAIGVEGGPEGIAASVPGLIQALKHNETEIRSQAVYALRTIGSGASSAIPALIEALNDPEVEVRYRAARTFEKFGSDAFDVIPALQKALDDPHPLVRRYALESLEAIILARDKE